MLIHHDIDQNNSEWLGLRAGKITGSAIAKIMANYGWIGGEPTKAEITKAEKEGLSLLYKPSTMKAFGEPARTYAATLAVERLTDKPVSSTFYSDHMKRGHEQEPLARMAYEAKTFTSVLNGGFYDNGWMGCSPDGRPDPRGLNEFKCVTPGPHYSVIRKKSFDAQYKWQMVFNMWVADKDWIDFGSYCFDYPEETRMHIHRLILDDYYKDVRKMESRLIRFNNLVDETVYNIQQAA